MKKQCLVAEHLSFTVMYSVYMYSVYMYSMFVYMYVCTCHMFKAGLRIGICTIFSRLKLRK